MTNKLAKTVMRNISNQNLKSKNTRKRRDIGKKVNIETNRPYSRKNNTTSSYRENKLSNDRYNNKKTILLSNYSTLGESQGSKSKTRKPSQKRVKNLSSLTREIKGNDSKGGNGMESTQKRRETKRPSKGKMTLGELSRSKAGKGKETKASKSDRSSSRRIDSGNKRLSLDSLADSMKNNN